MKIPTRDNCAVLFLDLQAEIVPNSKTRPIDGLRRSAAALAKIATLHRVPAFLSVVPSAGAFLSEVTGPLGEPQQRPRTQTSAFSDQALVAALKTSGRSVLVLSGVASEIVVQRTALDALQAGYDVGVAVDATGGIDPRTEDAAWRRITAAGGFTTSVTTLIAELAGDFTSEIGGQSVAIMYESFGGNG
jgi:hypothetical protein